MWLDSLLDTWLRYKEYKIRLKQEAKICQSCETLKIALDRANYEKEQLLRKVLEKDEPKPTEISETESTIPVLKRHIPWRVRQQALEAEDREQARIMRQFRDEESKIDTAALENSLGISGEKDAAS